LTSHIQSRSVYFEEENKRLIILPLQIIAAIVVIVGAFAMMFEVTYFAEFSFEVYFGRLIATFVGFVTLVISNFAVGQAKPTFLIHLLLLTIIASFASIIIKIPTSLFINSHLLALVIFTSALFLNWDMKNQIIVAIYYNILFASSILLTDRSIYFMHSMYASVVYVIVISMLSIIASSVNYRLRQKAIEKTFEARDLFENSIEALFKVRLEDFVFLTVNPSFLNLFKINDERSFYDKTKLSELFAHEPGFKEFFDKTSGSENLANFISQFKRDNGEQFIGMLNVRVVLGSDPNKKFLEGSIRDITTEKLAEEKIKKYNTQLELLNDSKDKFFSIVAHDLISPFSAVLGYSEILLEDFKDLDKEQVGQFAHDINSISQKAFNLLNELLDWSRIQTGRMPFEPDAIKVNSVVHDLVTLYEENAKKKSISLLNNVDDSHQIYADLKMISATLRNLISNSIKFTGNGGKIEINSKLKDDSVEISVVDNGIGINKEDLEKIFKIDVHHTQIGTNKEKGTGLGLILCQEFVQKNGGNLKAESEFGKGSKFFFTVPQPVK
jgi:signal transduction histidine kinase